MTHEFAMYFLSNIKNQIICFCSWGQTLDPHACHHDPQVKKTALNVILPLKNLDNSKIITNFAEMTGFFNIVGFI